MKKPTFVFDLGNVIIYYKPTGTSKRFGRGRTRRRVQARHVQRSRLAGLRRGSGHARGKSIMCSAPQAGQPDIRRIIGGCNRYCNYRAAALKRLTMDGYDCYFLSNTNASAMEYMNGFDYMGMFKGGSESYAVKLSKPDHAIFRLFAERFQSRAGACSSTTIPKQSPPIRGAVLGRTVWRRDADGLYARRGRCAQQRCLNPFDSHSIIFTRILHGTSRFSFIWTSDAFSSFHRLFTFYRLF